jgi:hypothetical protein
MLDLENDDEGFNEGVKEQLEEFEFPILEKLKDMDGQA